MEKILEVFKQAKVNISLLDAIQQVSSYAKFLKNLCNHKRTLNVPNKAFLMATNSTLTKYKDPGCPTISCVIVNTIIDNALLDLGSHVNLLPLVVFKQLELGECKPPRMTLQLIDRSIKVHHGVIEDVLIKVEKFTFHVNFIVLETRLVTILIRTQSF